MDNTSILTETLKSIEDSIAGYEDAIKRGTALDRLMSNPDFQLVILDGYIEAEAERLFTILTDPSGATPYTPEKIQLKLASISDFKGYVGTKDYPGTIKREADKAPGLIFNENEYRKQFTAEHAQANEDM